jgi:hypothetical protein
MNSYARQDLHRLPSPEIGGTGNMAPQPMQRKIGAGGRTILEWRRLAGTSPILKPDYPHDWLLHILPYGSLGNIRYEECARMHSDSDLRGTCLRTSEGCLNASLRTAFEWCGGENAGR